VTGAARPIATGTLRQRWLDLSLQGKGLCVLTIPMVALVVGLSMSWTALRAERAADARVTHTLDVEVELSNALTLLVDAETAVRGFLLTRDRKYLQPFDAAVEAIPVAFSRLEGLVSDNPSQDAAVQRLQTLAEQRLTMLVALQGAVPAAYAAHMGSGLQFMNEIRDQIRQMQAAENVLLDTRRGQTRAARRATAFRLLITSGLGVGLGIAAMVLFIGGVSSRLGELARNATHLERSEAMEALPSADDEVGRLGARLSAAALVLETHQKEIVRTQTELDQFFSLSLDMLSIVAADGTFKRVNPAWSETLGWSATDLVGHPYIDFVHPEDREATVAEARHLTAGSKTLGFENRYRSRDGTYRWLNWRVAPNEGGELLYAATRDVTDARLAREELSRRATQLADVNRALELAKRDMQAILDNSPVIVFVTDPDGHYRLLNRASVGITGREPETLLGKTVADVFPAAVADQLRTNTQRVLTEGQVMTFEETLPTPAGSRVFSVVRFPLRDADGHITAVCGMSVDVTEQKAAAEAIQLASAEALRANRAKSDFLSRMSHELRTPLNAILGFTQLFDRERMNDDERENVRHILEGGRHLLDLINEVIDISRVESGTLALSNEPVDIQEAISGAINLIHPLASANRISVTIEPLPAGVAVLADRQRLRQVLLNLLSNAVKYNRQDGSIRVSASQPRPGRVRVSVQDTGAGIPPQLLSHLFQPFERLGADKSAIEGTGLGLTLSRALCEAMGGKLEVESVVDRGSIFSLELAETVLEPASAPVALPETASTLHATSGLIVYVEDNSANVKLMARILGRRPGIEMCHAADGRSGIEMVRQRQPDLVLLDLQLPEMSGETVLHELWKDPATRRIPVVILTADATRGLPQRLIQAGARACLTKPLDVHQVLRTVDELMTV